MKKILLRIVLFTLLCNMAYAESNSCRLTLAKSIAIQTGLHAAQLAAYPVGKILSYVHHLHQSIRERTYDMTFFKRSDLVHLPLYLFFAANAMNSEVHDEEVYEKLKEEFKKNPSAKPRILFIDGFDKSTESAKDIKGFKENFLSEQLADVDYIYNNQVLKDELEKRRNLERKYDIVIFSGHGNNGLTNLPGEKNYLIKENLNLYSEDFKHLVDENTLLMFSGCSVLGGQDGREFGEAVKNEFKPGRVLGSTVSTYSSSSDALKVASLLSPGAILFSHGIKNAKSDDKNFTDIFAYIFRDNWVLIGNTKSLEKK